MKQLKAKILENKHIAPDFYRMRVESPSLAANIKPGQFVEVRCSKGVDPLLRRPLGAHRILRNGIELLYEIAGKGTQILSLKEAGESIDIIGPLGNGFTITGKAPAVSGYSAILVAGGVGVAPLVALAEALVRGRERIYVIIGAKSKGHILCENVFKEIGAKVAIATEDGSKGAEGLVTDILKTTLCDCRKTGDSIAPVIYACGPNGMLKAVAGIAKGCGIRCEVSLEERMACGVGVCLGCPVRIKPKRPSKDMAAQGSGHVYKMVCKDGPVFNAEEVIL